MARGNLLLAVLALLAGVSGFAGGMALIRRRRPLDVLGAVLAPLGLLLVGLGLGEIAWPGFWRR